MDPKDAAMIVLMFIVFGVPALALAARLVIRPLLEAMDRLRERPAAPALPDPRIAALEAQVSRLNVEVERLNEAEAFHRQLLSSNKTAT